MRGCGDVGMRGCGRPWGQIPKVSDPLLVEHLQPVIPSERSESRDLHLQTAARWISRGARGGTERTRRTALRVAIHAPALLLSIHDPKNLNGPVERSLRHTPRLRGPRRRWPDPAPAPR